MRPREQANRDQVEAALDEAAARAHIGFALAGHPAKDINQLRPLDSEMLARFRKWCAGAVRPLCPHDPAHQQFAFWFPFHPQLNCERCHFTLSQQLHDEGADVKCDFCPAELSDGWELSELIVGTDVPGSAVVTITYGACRECKRRNHAPHRDA